MTLCFYSSRGFGIICNLCLKAAGKPFKGGHNLYLLFKNPQDHQAFFRKKRI